MLVKVFDMQCNPMRWLWGLIPLLGLGGLMHLSGSFAQVERDLNKTSDATLAAAGQGWASVVFSGRDATLVGESVDSSDQLRAGGLVRSIWGVRKFEDQTRLLDEQKNYVWGAQVQPDGKIRLSGFVPTPASRTAVLAAVKSAFPSRVVDDGMKLARGAPAQSLWDGSIAFASKQLAGLKPGGRVDLDSANLLIEGEAEDLATYKSVKAELQTGLPQGLRLRSDKVMPPVVKPYLWSAKSAANQLVLTGYVPNERARDEIFAAAKKAFPKSAIVDRMQIAAGEPRDWLAAAIASLAKLGRLDDGSVDFRDAQMTIAGLATDAGVADEVRRALRSMPSSFRSTEALRVKEIPLKTIEPFTTSISVAGGVIVLSGYAPSPAARTVIVDAAKARLPGLRIDDKLEIANGAPDGWQTCAQAGVRGLARLGEGRAQMSARSLVVSGQTDREDLSQALPGEVGSAAGGACASEVRIVFTGVSAEELKRRAEAEVAARATAEKAAADKALADKALAEQARMAAETAAAEKAAAERIAADRSADKAAADRKAAEDAARSRVATAEPAPVPVPQVKPAPQIREEAANCQVLLTEAKNEGVINFKRASAEIDRQSNATLNRIVNVMGTCKSAKIEIQGHTDAEGTPERNINLSNRRARAVLGYLTDAGVDPARLTAVGYGETKPVAPNDTRENMARNRRIEFDVQME